MRQQLFERLARVIGIVGEANADGQQAIDGRVAVIAFAVERDADAQAHVDGRIEVDHPAHRFGNDQLAVGVMANLIGRRCARIGARDQTRGHGLAAFLENDFAVLKADDDECIGQRAGRRWRGPRTRFDRQWRRIRQFEPGE